MNAARRTMRAALALVLLAVFAGLVSLGVWQVQRLSWKLDLIDRVERRLAAAPVDTPDPALWAQVGKDHEYTRLKANGRYATAKNTLVQAVTNLGPGFWVLSPLVTDRGYTILINRGFVPDRDPKRLAPPVGEVAVTGLLRLSEPKGAYLRDNDPRAGRWYSRDVAAIARRHGLHGVAPYFIDADAATSPAWPRGGLTVVKFPNNHLVYALTWFGMAALLGGVLVWLWIRRSPAS